MERIAGKNGVEGISLQNVKTMERRDLRVGGVFMYVGWEPNTNFLKGVIDLDKSGFVLTDAQMATSRPGVYAAGDVRQKLLRQVVTAVADGAIAAFAAERYIETLGDS